jgi:diaminopimelate decarboxylase
VSGANVTLDAVSATEGLQRVFPRTAVFADGRLAALGGVEVERLAAEHGTPLWVVDRAELVGRMREYREAFGPEVGVVYAAKALCVTGVLQLAAREGLWVDVASGGELATTAAAHVPMERVVFHGNNKSVAELEEAARLGVGRIVVDSFAELERLADVAARFEHLFRVLLRVTPGVETDTHAHIRTGHDDSKFGFTLSAGLADRAVDRAVELPGVELVGLHSHVGSQILAGDAFESAVVAMVELLVRMRMRHRAELPELNLGGGLGIAYTRDDLPVPIAEYARRLLAAVDAECASLGVERPRLFVEPGRSISGPSGVTLYRVGTVKEIPGVNTYVAVDGGMSDNPRPALYEARYEFAPAGPGKPVTQTRLVAVAGKHCETGDVLARDVPLPVDLAEGELLAVAATGAYNQAMASNYNRLARPAMVLVGDGRAELLLRGETVQDVLSHDVPLDLSDA